MGNDTSSESLCISNLTAVTKCNSCLLENREDVTLIWLDKTIDTTRTTLREITDYVLLYTELKPCIEHIRSINRERIFLIVSGGYTEQCLDEVHDLPQVDSIFIFCMNVLKFKNELFNQKRFTKIIDIFDDEEQLIQSIRNELHDLRKQLPTFSLYEKQTPSRDLSKESATFLWFQLLKDVLLSIPRSEAAKCEMIEQCRQYYRGNPEELKNIDEFAKTYAANDAISWYAKQCFIYRLCNKALRTEDIESLYLFRYYIQDLSKHLSIEHETFRTKETDQPVLTSYRGLKLTKEELSHLQSNVGSLISVDGFLSTTRDYNLALEFALKISKRSVDVFPTLLIIQADIHLDDMMFADISALSAYPDEKEVLFDLGCAFKINEVYCEESKNIWVIRLNLTNESRQIVEKYLESNRGEVEKGNILLVFGSLLTEMGECHRAQVYFENLLSSGAINDKASLYASIGRVKFYNGLNNEALNDFKTVHYIQRHANPINYVDLVRTMNHLGLIYLEQKKYDLALGYHFDVLQIYQQQQTTPDMLLADNNDSIGVIFIYKREYENALKYLFHAMHLYEKHLPTIDHPIMATNYNNIGLVFYYTEEHQRGLDYCLKALNIREKILPMSHPHIADSCNNVALIYHHLHQYEKALDLFQRSLQIYENDSERKMRAPRCFNNIGLLYLDQHNYDQAIEYYSKALYLYFSDNHKDRYREEIEFTLDNLGVAYEMKGDYENAVQYYHQALENPSKNLEKFVRISGKVGNIYHRIGDYELALIHYQNALNKSETSPLDLTLSLLMSMAIVYHRKYQYDLALDIYHYVLATHKHQASDHQLDLAWTYNNIGCLYDDIGDVARALKYQEKAHQIRRKSLPSTHPDLAVSLNNLGRVHQMIAYRSGGDPLILEQALQNYKSALNIRRKSLPMDHPDLAISYYNLALVHIEQEEYEQAFSEVLMALKIQRKKLPVNHPDLAQTLNLKKQVQSILNNRINYFTDRC